MSETDRRTALVRQGLAVIAWLLGIVIPMSGLVTQDNALLVTVVLLLVGAMLLLAPFLAPYLPKVRVEAPPRWKEWQARKGPAAGGVVFASEVRQGPPPRQPEPDAHAPSQPSGAYRYSIHITHSNVAMYLEADAPPFDAELVSPKPIRFVDASAAVKGEAFLTATGDVVRDSPPPPMSPSGATGPTGSLTLLRKPAPDSPHTPQALFKTEGRRDVAIDTPRRPVALRFRAPTDAVVREGDLPADVPLPQGKLVVTKFYERGFVVDEVETVGQEVRVDVYYAAA